MSPVKNTLELNILDSFDRMPNSDQGYRRYVAVKTGSYPTIWNGENII